MRTCRNLFLISLLLMAVPAYSSAEVKVTLKNGRSFVADTCKKASGRLVCQMEGGTMEIGLQDIAKTEETKGRGNAGSEQRFGLGGGDEAREQKTPEKAAADK